METPEKQPPAPEKVFDWYISMMQAGQFMEKNGMRRFFQNATLHLSIIGGSLLIASYIISNGLPLQLLFAVASVAAFGFFNAVIWAQQISRNAYYEGIWYGFAADIEDTPQFRVSTGSLTVKDQKCGCTKMLQAWSHPTIRERLVPERKHLGITPTMYRCFAWSLTFVYAILVIGSFLFWIYDIKKAPPEKGSTTNSATSKTLSAPHLLQVTLL